MTQHIIERAFELARSGECRTLSDIHQRLRREQFTQVSEHLGGRSIKAQLSQLMEQARETMTIRDPAERPTSG